MDDAAVIEARRDPFGGEAALALDVDFLARDVAGVLQVDENLAGDVVGNVGEFRQDRNEIGPLDLGTTESLSQRKPCGMITSP